MNIDGFSEMTAKVVRGGVTETIAMDVATYAENNRTFVPLRFFSQALGYDVFWDADYQTAVVIDADELIGSADANLKVLNGLMKSGSKYDMAKTYKSTGALTGELNRHRFVRRSPSPDRDAPLPLQNHPIRKRRTELKPTVGRFCTSRAEHTNRQPS